MTATSTTNPVRHEASTRTRAIVLRVLGAGLASSVPVVLLATIAVLGTPHARGIGFFPALRYAVVTPASVLATMGAAILYRALAARFERPRRVLVGVVAGLATTILLTMRVVGPPGLASAAFAAVMTVSLGMTLLVPWAFDTSRRSRGGLAAIALFGGLELLGLVAARSSERVAPAGPGGQAFDIPRSMFDADHAFMQLPSGARVHYVDEGKGDTLLFLHGNPSWSFQWRDLIHELRGSFRCVALDYPGFGLSEAPDGFGFTPREESLVVEEFVDRLGLANVTLVMQDWGGPIGLGLAGRRPELVRSVILGSTWAWPTDTTVPRGKFSWLVGGPIGEFAQMNFNAFASFGIDNGVVRELPSDVADVYERPFLPLERRGIAAFYPGQINGAKAYFAEVEAALPRLADKNALVFWALQDEGFPRSDRERFEKTFPKHKTVELPNANHFFFEDELARMVPEIRTFMASESVERVTLPARSSR